MANVVGVVFLLGFAVQRVLELLDPFVIALSELLFDKNPKGKEWTAGLISFVVGLLMAWPGTVRLLSQSWDKAPVWLDVLVTAVVLSAGTEAVNIVVKYLSYKKQAAKAGAVAAEAHAQAAAAAPQPGADE